MHLTYDPIQPPKWDNDHHVDKQINDVRPSRAFQENESSFFNDQRHLNNHCPGDGASQSEAAAGAAAATTASSESRGCEDQGDYHQSFTGAGVSDASVDAASGGDEDSEANGDSA